MEVNAGLYTKRMGMMVKRVATDETGEWEWGCNGDGSLVERGNLLDGGGKETRNTLLLSDNPTRRDSLKLSQRVRFVSNQIGLLCELTFPFHTEMSNSALVIG